jgi:type II secretory pathway pseudopilin PulG
MKREAINQSLSTRHANGSLPINARSGEEGWALLGLLLALSVMSIFLVSSVAPNVKMQVQREKEDEMVYRGNQMAKAIARYYGNGRIPPSGLQVRVPPPFGYLTEMKKLRDGITVGVKELKLVRASEMIDPMVGVEWEPVRAGDKRIFNFLQAYTAQTTWIITGDYYIIAGQVQPKPIFGGDTTNPPPPPGGQTHDPNDPDPNDPDPNDQDPLKDLFGSSGSQPGNSNMPIVGVAPKLKGEAIRPYFGLKKYDEWVFMYVPPPNQLGSGMQPR